MTDEAVHWYTEAAMRGHAIAQNNLGVLNSTGHRGSYLHTYLPTYLSVNDLPTSESLLSGRRPRDPAEALYWYRESAKKGYVSGQFHAGLMCMSGQGMNQPNASEAFDWFKKAGKQGHPLAQSNVGAMCKEHSSTFTCMLDTKSHTTSLPQT